MTAMCSYDPICKRIIDALGLKNVVELELTMAVDKVVTVKVKFFAEKDGLLELPAILAEYKLVPKEKEKTVVGDEHRVYVGPYPEAE